MNALGIWEYAMDYLEANAERPQELLARWRSEIPGACSDRDLFAEYGWVVAACGLSARAIQGFWPRLGQAMLDWDHVAVSEDPLAVRMAALTVLHNPRKVDAILSFAQELARSPGMMARLAAQPLKTVLAQLATLPFVGASNRFHLARNLGWDVVVRTGPVVRLAGYLGTTAEALCSGIAAQTGERIRTVDLVLWYWGHRVGDRELRETARLLAGLADGLADGPAGDPAGDPAGEPADGVPE